MRQLLQLPRSAVLTMVTRDGRTAGQNVVRFDALPTASKA